MFQLFTGKSGVGVGLSLGNQLRSCRKVFECLSLQRSLTRLQTLQSSRRNKCQRLRRKVLHESGGRIQTNDDVMHFVQLGARQG